MTTINKCMTDSYKNVTFASSLHIYDKNPHANNLFCFILTVIKLYTSMTI